MVVADDVGAGGAEVLVGSDGGEEEEGVEKKEFA